MKTSKVTGLVCIDMVPCVLGTMEKSDLHQRSLEAFMHLLGIYGILVYYEQTISDSESTIIMFMIYVLFKACWV